MQSLIFLGPWPEEYKSQSRFKYKIENQDVKFMSNNETQIIIIMYLFPCKDQLQNKL